MMSENLLESGRIYFSLRSRVKHNIWNYSGLLKKGVLSHQTNTKYVRVVTFFVPVDEPICVLSPPSAKHVQLVARRPWGIIITSVVNTIVTRSLSDIAHLRLPSTTTMAESKKKAPATHPSCIDMIVAAIGNLKEKNGSSAQAIKKYIAANYNVDMEKLATHIRKAFVTGVEKGKLVQTKGKGQPVPSNSMLQQRKQTPKPRKLKKQLRRKRRKRKKQPKRKPRKRRQQKRRRLRRKSPRRRNQSAIRRRRHRRKRLRNPRRKQRRRRPPKLRKPSLPRRPATKRRPPRSRLPRRRPPPRRPRSKSLGCLIIQTALFRATIFLKREKWTVTRIPHIKPYTMISP